MLQIFVAAPQFLIGLAQGVLCQVRLGEQAGVVQGNRSLSRNAPHDLFVPPKEGDNGLPNALRKDVP